MKKVSYLFEDGNHKWAVAARDPDKPNCLIDTNEYLIINGDEAIITDPGGMEIFPAVFTAFSEIYRPENIQRIFASHQDPDIISSLTLWMQFNPAIRCYLSWLWTSFVPHFGGNEDTFIPIPDPGMSIALGHIKLELVPAHFIHSAGNFHLYDAKAKIFFSGDVGAAMVPVEEDTLFVEDFDSHIRYAEAFHKRWMGSNEAKNDWCQRVREMDIEMLCPQHGAIYKGDDVAKFIDWFEKLEVGVLRS